MAGTYGLTALKKIQLGQETTAGTAVAATIMWRGPATLTDTREIAVVDEDIGQMLPTSRTVVPRLGAEITLESTPATFEHLPYILAAGVEDLTTGVADGSGSGKIYQHDVALTAANSIQTYTIEAGNNVENWDVEYCFVRNFELSGAMGEPVNVTATLVGRQLTNGVAFASLTPATVEEILFGKGKLYIDDTTIGTTQVTGGWIGFTLNVDTGFRELYTGDGAAYFAAHKQVRPEITGELVLEHDSTFGDNEINEAKNEVKRKVRMVFDGTALTTAGTAYTYKTLQVDMAIQYTAVPSLDDQDGDSTIRLPFRAVYDVAADAPIFYVVNQNASLT